MLSQLPNCSVRSGLLSSCLLHEQHSVLHRSCSERWCKDLVCAACVASELPKRSHHTLFPDFCSRMYCMGLKKSPSSGEKHNGLFALPKFRLLSQLLLLGKLGWQLGNGSFQGLSGPSTCCLEQPLRSLLETSHQCKVQMRLINCLIEGPRGA